MQVPETCTDWRTQMESDRGGAGAVLRNIEQDLGTPPDIAATFFERLVRKGPFDRADAAWDGAKRVVFEDPDLFYCRGRTVPESRFRGLLRIMQTKHWEHLFPHDAEADLARIRQQLGVRRDPYLAKPLTNKQAVQFSMSLSGRRQVGRESRIAWVADTDHAAPGLHDARHLTRCLGLPHFEKANRALVLRYHRDAVKTPMAVPRAFDGIDSPAFRVAAPDADEGRTHPTREAGAGARGYPEAVHRSGIVDAVHVDLVDLHP